MSNLSQFFSGGASIKSTQRGVIVFSNGATSATATISTVDTAKSELRMLGANGSAQATSNQEIIARIALTNSTTITATAVTTVSNDCRISWELTEWN